MKCKCWRLYASARYHFAKRAESVCRRMMRFAVRAISCLLVGLAVTFLGASLWIAVRVVFYAKSEPSITIAALLATVAGLFLTAQRQMADREDATSRFFLDQYLSGFDTAYEILESVTAADPLMRMKWIAAARVLAIARSMLDRITVSAHRAVAKMNIPHQSQRFRQFFLLPATAYYGVVSPANMSAEESLTEAARRSSQGEGEAVNIVRTVPEKVINTIWQALAYPKEYKDVLGERFNEAERIFLPAGL